MTMSATRRAVSRDSQDVEYTVGSDYCRARLSRTRRRTVRLASTGQLSSTVDGPRLGRLCSNRGVESTATRVELRKPRLAEHLERELGYLGYSEHFCIRGR